MTANHLTTQLRHLTKSYIKCNKCIKLYATQTGDNINAVYISWHCLLRQLPFCCKLSISRQSDMS